MSRINDHYEMVNKTPKKENITGFVVISYFFIKKYGTEKCQIYRFSDGSKWPPSFPWQP